MTVPVNIPTQIIIHTISVSINDTSSTVLPSWAILDELILCIAPADFVISSIPPDEADQYWKILPS